MPHLWKNILMEVHAAFCITAKLFQGLLASDGMLTARSCEQDIVQIHGELWLLVHVL